MRIEIILRVFWNYGMKDDVNVVNVISFVYVVKECIIDGVVGIDLVSERN